MGTCNGFKQIIILVFIATFFCCPVLGACKKSTPKQGVTQLGKRIAFDYHRLSDADADYLSRFDVVVTHDPQDGKIFKRLKAKGAKLFFYEWLPAFYYTATPGPWERRVYRNREAWTLDPGESDPDPMGERLHCRDYFYDMANDALLSARVAYLAAKVKSHGYDGIFFDWGSGWHAFQENGYTFLIEAFEKRHPGTRYNDRINLFVRKLKENGLFVMLNGAFRSENAELDKYADVDIVESMFTSDQCQTNFRVSTEKEGSQEGCDTWFNSLNQAKDLADYLPQKARSVNPSIRFMFLNYAFPFYREVNVGAYADKTFEKTVDKQALYYSLVMSYLGNSSGFMCGKDVSLNYALDEIYFVDIGEAAGEAKRIGRNALLKYFSSGFVVAADHDENLYIKIPRNVAAITDLYNSSRIEITHGKAKITLKSEKYPSGNTYPMGGIYRYEY